MEKNSKLKNKKIVIFSHDAGGAQVLSSYLFSENINKVYGICKGPALKIFQEKNINVKNLNIKKAIKIGEYFFTSTSWKSKIEKNAMKNLVNKKKKFITFIDHWTHYKSRFDFRYLPDEIWSFDLNSYKICKKIFKSVKIVLKPNFFQKYAINKISQYKKNNKYKINFLYLTEPLSNLYKKIYKKKILTSETDALNFFLGKCESKNKITIRVHPNDNFKKYKYILKKFSHLSIKFDNKTSIYKQLALNYNIVSYQSSVLNLAYKNKNKVFCSSPNKKFKIHYLKNENNYVYNYERI